ncbi:Ion-translocating oxidoreductase complex, subunit D [Desulfonema limicola]|uniref:Ion-translocating oxidoreductase complex subunit D n=1 Tax=Desulfonema limicola TaxID=45656 RepID=A0A975B6M5_9BACT|nr:RnfABCDGE type electron transport complex subunit D [Desulfonema limicola]QTA79607.1 Ion-translocating oxidoreductase complex, subunit D [Desulfonema limicola]
MANDIQQAEVVETLHATSLRVQDAPVIHVAPSPHLSNTDQTTRTMMRDVLIALSPVVAVAVYVFKMYAVTQLAVCVISCLAAEMLFTGMRGRKASLCDYSAAVTGIILAMSLPGTAPWYVGIIASFTAIGIGKIIFGGLGMNIFNPAMVGRAFVMIAFASALGASGYQDAKSAVDAITQATPMDAFKQGGVIVPLSSLFWGTTNGSLGETSAIACLIGGLYLCIRRTASWEIPAGVIGTVIVLGGIANLLNPESQWTVLHHLLGGALLFGAFFIATDPVTSPLTPKGKLIFGAGTGAFIMLLRIFSGYPEGVMFAVLIMNSLTPLINRWTVPRPLGGK